MVTITFLFVSYLQKGRKKINKQKEMKHFVALEFFFFHCFLLLLQP